MKGRPSIRRGLLVGAALALTLAAAHWAVRRARTVEDAPAAGADWIWSQPRGEPGSPTAFFAIKDFDLDFPAAKAELRILADEEYILTLNDYSIGAGNYAVSSDLAVYAVEALLRRRNRLFVELRSARGVGGFLMRLEISGPDGQRAEVVTDESWRIVRRFDRNMRRPGAPFQGRPPRVWGPQPSGRWGTPMRTVDVPTLRELQNGKRRPVVPAVRQGQHGSPWRVAPRHFKKGLGPWARFDFGRVRTGYLTVRFESSERGPGFVYYDLRRPPQGLEDWGDVVLRVPGRDQWTASRPASFRFVTVAGMPGVTGVEVIPVNPDKVESMLAPEPRESLLGIERVKTLMSPVEDEIRGKLQGVPGLARRKEG